MRIGYLDCPSGISGDMLLGALVDAGLSIDELRAELAKLPVEGYRLEAEKTQRAGLAATKVTVVLEEAQASASSAGTPHRRLPDILSIINDSALPPEDKERSAQVFCKLAQAEARVHGVEPEAVEFHEVGAVDAIVDVVGTVIGLRLLGVEALYCSSLPVGGGWTNGEHGRLPVPAPATLALLSEVGAPLAAGPDAGMELVTPTGAALVATLAAFERPAMTVRVVGYGAGSRELEDRPNALRLWLGEALDERRTTMLLIETNIDDMSPELIGYAQERLFDAGAADVWLAPVQMKKNRPGVLLSVICSVEREDAMVEIILRETSTLGVRVRPVTRHEAEREELQFESSLGPAAVKVKRLPGRPPSVAPEYEACARIARERGLPLQEVYRIVEVEAREHLAGS
ncbi:MAG: nickel pincer cofactor biosynthesis protein LarC [Chloroflexi bacterium]|nr:nickel pincer cofactor biosynthesis protein LarC [Chloroflexota bacterium]